MSEVDELGEDEAPGLFTLEAAVPSGGVGRAELGLEAAITAASHLGARDSALVGGARVAARALDNAERIGGLKGGYLVAQLLRPYQDALEALALVDLVTGKGLAARDGEDQGDDGAGSPVPDAVPAWWGQEFGTPQ